MDKIITIKNIEAFCEDDFDATICDVKNEYGIDLDIIAAPYDSNYNVRLNITGAPENVKRYFIDNFDFCDGDLQGFEGTDPELDKLFNIE